MARARKSKEKPKHRDDPKGVSAHDWQDYGKPRRSRREDVRERCAACGLVRTHTVGGSPAWMFYEGAERDSVPTRRVRGCSPDTRKKWAGILAKRELEERRAAWQRRRDYRES
jgi:hypothetical protein